MITERDLKEAIAECQGTRNPNANTCIKLASYYTIMDHIEQKRSESFTNDPAYSYAPPPSSNTVNYDGESQFSRLIDGRDADEMWKIMDELMDTLRVINPRLYDGVIRKLQ